MKNLIITTILILVCWTFIHAQETSDADSCEYKKNYIYLNPTQAIFYTFQLGYERAFTNNRQSVLIEAGYHRETSNGNIITGYAEELQYRIFLASDKTYPKDKLIFDIYLGAYINHKFFNFEANHLDAHNLIYGLVGGCRLSYYNFVCDIHCGGGYKSIFIST